MKTILLLGNDAPSFYSFRLELIKSLLQSGYKVFISLPYGKEVDLLIEQGCHFIHTPLKRKSKNPITDFWLFTRYVFMFRKLKPDMVLTFTIKPNIYGSMACALLHIPYITNITGLGTAVEIDGMMQRLTICLYKLAMRRASCILFQNQANLDFFRAKGIRPDIGVLIPGSGVPLDRFIPLEYPNEKTVEFLYIARIMKPKGIDQYLDAAKYIRRKYPNTQFHILGTCEEDYQGILDNLHNEGIIQYHGQQFNIHPFLTRTHCTIHPSYYPEGISNVLLESEASCRPVITTDRSGCIETVDDGKTGFVVKQRDSKDLIRKIEYFLALPYEQKKQMGLNARKKVEKEFDRRIVVNMYLKQIYANI